MPFFDVLLFLEYNQESGKLESESVNNAKYFLHSMKGVFMKKKSKIIIAILCVVSLLVIGCALTDDESTDSSTAEKTETTTEESGDTVAEDSEADKEAEADAEDDKEEIQNRPNADTGEGEKKTLSEGDVAPEFTVDLVNGNSFKLSDYDDKIVILNFWATWCGPCVGEMPAFQKLLEDGDENLEIVCINCMEDKQTVKSFVESEGYTFNIGYDVDGRIEEYYPTDGIPYTLIINKGKISEIFVGAVDADTQYREYKNAIEACK